MLVVVLALTLAGCGGADPAAPSAPPTSAPAPPKAGVSCPAGVDSGEQVRLVGGKVGGVIWGTGRSGVLLAHQTNGDLCMWIDYKDALVGAGYRVLALDLPGYGSSLHANDVAIDDAVVAGAGLLRDRGAAKVVLVGASMGGTAVVGGAAKAQPPVAGVISLSGPATFAAVHADDLARQLAVPALFAACDGDGSFANDARSMYQVTPAAVPRQLVVDSCVAHGVDMLRTSDPVKAAVTAFLAKYAPA